MSDAFLTLAYTENGLSCFFVPRWTPDGKRNVFLIQRLKDKLGNRANASSEIEYDGTWARLVGEEGRGVRTIIEMVHGTRLDTCAGPVGLMRQAVTQAIHHASHRNAFQRKLSQQPLMQNVLADLALESEAATSLMLRIAGAYDRSATDPQEAAFARIAVAVSKYWINKRTPPLIYEALECHGGSGYIEESVMARIYREAPLNSIWEGSGNVICLDVLRAMQRDPDSVEALRAELAAAQGMDPRLDAHLAKIEQGLADPAAMELRARRMVELLALALQGSLMARHAPPAVAEAFLASRLDGDWGLTFGSLPADTDFTAIMERAAIQ
jgi:putative acyl-CoA dehydrogenase